MIGQVLLYKLARLLWRLMPRPMRTAMALEAPLVLTFNTYAGWNATTPAHGWLRREIEYCAGPTAWDDDQEITAWGFGRYTQTDEFTGEYPTHGEAFDALTAHLRSRSDVILLGGP